MKILNAKTIRLDVNSAYQFSEGNRIPHQEKMVLNYEVQSNRNAPGLRYIRLTWKLHYTDSLTNEEIVGFVGEYNILLSTEAATAQTVSLLLGKTLALSFITIERFTTSGFATNRTGPVMEISRKVPLILDELLTS